MSTKQVKDGKGILRHIRHFKTLFQQNLTRVGQHQLVSGQEPSTPGTRGKKESAEGSKERKWTGYSFKASWLFVVTGHL